MYISDNEKHFQLFNKNLSHTIWAAIWGSWQLKYVKFWPFCSFSGLPLLATFSFVLVCRHFFLLYQKLKHLWTLSLRKSSMVIPGVLIGNRAFRALLDRRFLTSDLMIFIWLNSLSSDAFDTGAQRHISIISSASLQWEFLTLREIILVKNSKKSILSLLKFFRPYRTIGRIEPYKNS